jgi:hypothetical protein
MPGTSYLPMLVAVVAGFGFSSVWYVLFGEIWTRLRAANPDAVLDMKKAPAWKKLAELVRSLILALVLARLVALYGIIDWLAALEFGFWLWIGFPVVLLAGSVMWENVPWKVAAIHAGDWLGKMLLMTVILGAWR